MRCALSSYYTGSTKGLLENIIIWRYIYAKRNSANFITGAFDGFVRDGAWRSAGNFPAESMGKDAIVIRCDGHGVPELLDAVLKLFPLDTYVEKPVNLMEVVPGDDVETPIWDTYKDIIAKYDKRGAACVGNIERFAFYDEAKTAYAIIATSEKALYANIMLQKGVVVE